MCNGGEVEDMMMIRLVSLQSIQSLDKVITLRKTHHCPFSAKMFQGRNRNKTAKNGSKCVNAP